MKEQLDQCLGDFFEGWKLLEPDPGKRSKLCRKKLDYCFQCAPHKRPKTRLRRHQRAIYIFFKDNRWLRIGQTDHDGRFRNQHYGIAKGNSTLANDIRDNPGEFGFSGSDNEIPSWILKNCGRANLRLPVQGVEPKVSEYFAKLLESYLHYRLNPRFEGRRRGKESAT